LPLYLHPGLPNKRRGDLSMAFATNSDSPGKYQGNQMSRTTTMTLLHGYTNASMTYPFLIKLVATTTTQMF
jgi:hypothetical protein